MLGMNWIFLCIVTVVLGFSELTRSQTLPWDFNCHVEKICPTGVTVSCESRGSGAKCDILSDGVSCQYYESGRLQIDTKSCPRHIEDSGQEVDAMIETKATSDAEFIFRRPDGLYDVKCNDGSRERVDRATLDSGDICRGGLSTGRFQIRCDGFGRYAYPSRSSDGMRFGAFISPSDCQMIAETSLSQVTCGSYMPGVFDITRISDGSRLGGHMSLNSCLEAALFNRQGVTCILYSSGSRMVRVNTGQTIGTSNTASSCMTALRFAREGVACIDFGGGQWTVTRLADGERFGRAASLEDCVKATDNAFMGKVCAQFGGGRWQIYDVASASAQPGHWSLDVCVTRL
jgi:hypothetical protein